jgi:hypothetical protein
MVAQGFSPAALPLVSTHVTATVYPDGFSRYKFHLKQRNHRIRDRLLAAPSS